MIAGKNPRAARFIPIPRRPDGRLDPDALGAALRSGFCYRPLAPSPNRGDAEEPIGTWVSGRG